MIDDSKRHRENHAPMRHTTKIFMAGRTGEMVWEDGSKDHLLCIYIDPYYIRVKVTATGKEFVTVREAMHRFYPEDPV